MMKLGRSAVFALSLGVSVFSVFGIAACGGSVEQPQTSASALSKAPVAQNSHGMVKVFGDALGEVALRTDQRNEIEKLAQAAEARHQPMAESRKELMLALADQVEKGNVDRAALQPKIDKVTADLESSRNEDRAALQKLHDLLDNGQRNAFVDALEKQFKGKRGEMHEHGGPGGFGKLRELGEELKLTDAQKSQIKDVMHDGMKDAHREMRAHGDVGAGFGGPREGKHALESFRQDKLDLPPPHDVKAGAQMMTDHMTGFAGKVVPILTPEQRKIVADKIRGMAQNGDASLLMH